MLWLIDERAGQELQRAYKGASALGSLKDIAELQERAEAEAAESSAETRIMNVVDGVAIIRIVGVLMPGPSLFSYLYSGGSTRYSEIRDALAKADADPAVKKASLYIDSPGGRVDGLFETLDAIKQFRKPMNVRATCACSGAYGLAAAAGGTIEAVNDASTFGSVGVVSTYYFWNDEEIIDVTSTEAPDKRPDVRTDEGKAVVRKHLDEIHDLFVEAIAEGRNVKAAAVNANYGRGAVMLARAAKSAGLIDRVPPKRRRAAGTRAEVDWSDVPEPHFRDSSQAGLPPVDQDQPQADTARGDNNTNPPPESAATGSEHMKLEELKSQHPALYSQVFEAGEKKGAEAALEGERDRVGAHLTMGEKSGDMKTAVEAIKSGAGMTQTLTAKYLAAGMDRADTTARQTESDQAAGAVDGAPSTGEPEGTDVDLGDQVVAALEGRSGSKKAS